MCGIAGLVGEMDQVLAERNVRKMTERLVHRGPDACNLMVEPNVALGHRRLSIIDLSARANQPFRDPSQRYAIVYNGEIYNFQEIRKKLPQNGFITQSDTETLLAAYMHWGPDCLQYLNGMFAFAIWDRNDQSLFVARDRLGIKPLYYTNTFGRFAFASEIRALLSYHFVDKKLSPSALASYLKYQTVHQPFTLIQGVFQLQSGEYGIWKNGHFNTYRYWSIGKKNGQLITDLEATKTRIKELLLGAVEKRLISDVPLGAFLSGGIDSSAIVALMAEVSDQPVHTFSIGFKEREFDESHFASIIAKKYNTNHTKITLTAKDFLDDLPRVLEHMDIPSGDGPNTYTVSRLTKNAGITVALSGLGGDELFAGYSYLRQYYHLARRKILWKLPLKLRQAVSLVGKGIYSARKAEKMSELLSLPGINIEFIYPLFRQALLTRDIHFLAPRLSSAKDKLQQNLAAIFGDISFLPLLSQATIGELECYTRDVLLRDTDQMSMAHALEVRVPFFDHELIEFVLQVPDKLKYPHSPKQLLVESLDHRLPASIVNRPKMGFTFPWAFWLRTELKGFAEEQINRLGRKSILDQAALSMYWKRFLNNDNRIPWNNIWLLIVLNHWMDRHQIESF